MACAVPTAGNGCLFALLTVLVPIASAGSEPVLRFEGPSRVSGAPGTTVRVECFGVVSVEGEAGIWGWSIGFIARNAAVASVTTVGTALDGFESLGGGASANFELAELVDPALNGGRSGAVSAVFLGRFVELLPGEAHRILRIGIDVPIPDASGSAELEYVDGLVGSGQPVRNEVNVGGIVLVPGLVPFAIETLPAPPRFLRADSNADGRRDISDAVSILNGLFAVGGPLPCDDAADANDDGRLDISDAVLILNHLFGEGGPPAEPFSDCGRDPTGDALGCEGRTSCGG